MHRSLIVTLTVCVALLASASLTHAQEDDPFEPFDWVTWYRENGFDSFEFTSGCVSVGADGSVIRGEPLPVSSERWLECATYDDPTYEALKFRDDDGALYCALGQIGLPGTGGDDRLSISILAQRSGEPWTLQAISRSGDAFEIGTVEGFGARLWPVWVHGHYDVLNIVPTGPTDDCDVVFGL